MKRLLAFIALVFTSVTFCFSQYTYMVKDLSDLNNPSDPQSFMTAGSLKYFVADDGLTGDELWRTDGTTAGTFLVKDINPGTESAFDFFWVETPLMLEVSGDLIFGAEDSLGYQLWKTDGTTQGTVKLTSFTDNDLRDEPVVSLNSNIFFFYEHDLYKSDGTAAGTAPMLTNLSTAGPVPYYCLTESNGLLYFIGYDAANGYEVWTSDGTAAGSQLLLDINAGTTHTFTTSKLKPSFYTVNNTVFFLADDGINGLELWKSDGTGGGTSMVKDINPGNLSAITDDDYIQFQQLNNKLYFLADEGVDGYALWTSDGTSAGTSLIKDFTPGISTYVGPLQLLNGEIIFSANDGVNGAELWKSDGTPSGTVMITDLMPGWFGSGPHSFNVMNNKLYFVAAVSFTPYIAALHVTDGTAGGTQLLLTNYATNGDESFCLYNNQIYFSWVDSVGYSGIWKIDNVSGLPQRIVDVVFISAPGEVATNLNVLNGNILFTAGDSTTDNELWISDGTAAGTDLLKDINQTGNSYIQQLEDLNGLLMYSANDAVHGNELWRSNGHSSGTKLVLDANPSGGSAPYHLESFRNAVYYRCYSDNILTYHDLWRSQGTAATTAALDTLMVNVNMIKALDDELYISDAQGFWKSDGTAAGTQFLFMNYIQEVAKAGNYTYASSLSALYAVDSLNNNSVVASGMMIENLTAMSDTMYFTLLKYQLDTFWIDTTTYFIMNNLHDQLWKSGGQISNTAMITDSFNIFGMLPSGSNLYIIGDLGFNYGLYTYNSNTGISLVKQFYYSSGLTEMIELNGKVFFAAIDSSGDKELWVSDGTAGGTQIVKNINLSGNSSPDKFTAFNNQLYFTADDGSNGRELWRSDGTDAGTILLADINLSGSSNPAELTVSGDYIYFVADDGVYGRELWAHALSTTANCFAYFETTYDSASNTFTLAIDPVTVAAANAYSWNFGDGNTSSLANPSHTYVADDIYNVCLTAYSSSGDSCRYCHDLGKDLDGNVVLRGTGFNLVVMNGISSVLDYESADAGLLAAPNPTDGVSTIFFDGMMSGTVRVMNIQGEVISTIARFSSGSTLDLSAQPAGIYIVELISDVLTQRVKVVKK